MKKYYDDYLLLSAYLDNELTEKEKEYIEKKLLTSLELQNKLTELKQIKENIKNSKLQVPENPFLEQRVISALLEDKPQFIFSKKLIFAAGTIVTLIIISLSFIYIDFFNISSNNSKINSEYANNLEPLFSPDNLSSDDVFNFALYEELPIKNSDNQVLKIGFDREGTEYFELKKSASKVKKDNLKIFLSNLSLSDNKKEKVDSLFRVYAEKISKNILVGKNNSIAINPSVWNLRKAILADFIALTSELDSHNFDKLLNAHKILIPKNFVLWRKEIDSIKTNKYIVFTPDSVFTSEVNLSFNEQLNSNHDKFNLYNTDKKSFKIEFDSSLAIGNIKIIKNPNFIQFRIDNFEIPSLNIPDFDSFVEFVERSVQNQQNLNLTSTENSNNTKENLSKKLFIDTQYGVNLDSILELQNKRLESSQKKRIQKDNIKNNIDNNTTNDESIDDIKIELERLRKEVEKFRELFHNFMKEGINSDSLDNNFLIEEIEI